MVPDGSFFIFSALTLALFLASKYSTSSPNSRSLLEPSTELQVYKDNQHQCQQIYIKDLTSVVFFGVIFFYIYLILILTFIKNKVTGRLLNEPMVLELFFHGFLTCHILGYKRLFSIVIHVHIYWR